MDTWTLFLEQLRREIERRMTEDMRELLPQARGEQQHEEQRTPLPRCSAAER